MTKEDTLPYDRTMLSKGVFFVKEDKIQLRKQEHLDKFGISVMKNEEVVNVDYRKKYVETRNGAHLHYEKLLLATGGSPRVPPIKGSDLKNVLVLRDIRQMEKLKNSAGSSKNVVIIGASFIGMETASAIKLALKEKVNVTVVDMT